MFSNYKLAIFFCLFIFLASAQENINDSLVNKKATDAFALASKNSDLALQLSTEALEEATKLKSNRVIANAYNSIGWAYMHKGNLDASIVNLKKAHGIFLKLGSNHEVICVDINLAEVYTKKNQIADAIKYLLQGDSLSNKIKNIPLQTDIKRQLGIIYRESGDYKRASKYFKQAMTGFEKQQDTLRYVNTVISLSILYRNMKLPDSSLVLLKRSLSLIEKKADNTYQLAMVEENIGESYFQLKKFDSALDYYSKAYQKFKELDNNSDMAYEAFSIGKTLFELKNYPLAEIYLLKSYKLSDSLKLYGFQFDASTQLAELYKKTGKWEKAVEYLEQVSVLKDSIGMQEQIGKTNELKEKFESDKQEQEILLLKTKNELAEADNQRIKTLQYVFILLFAISILLGWLLLNRFKIKRKLEQQVLRNRIAEDLHDDIGSTLSSIDISSRIALVKKDDAGIVNDQLSKIRQQARKTMESMSDIVWSINPSNDTIESMTVRMREFASEICEPQEIELEFHPLSDTKTIVLNAEKRKNIFLIYKEAINNTLKYSGCTKLKVAFNMLDKNTIQMIINDNGKGFNLDTIRKGNGIANMKSRAGQIGADLNVSPKLGEGTVVELTCRI